MRPLCTITLLAVLLQAQTQAQQSPTFKSAVQIVEVDARVFDKAGRFVDGLKQEDFEVFENGVPQQIQAVFLVESKTPGAGAAAQSAKVAAGETTESKPSLPVIPVRQTWLFVFDLNHLTPGRSFDAARKAVKTLIETRLQDGDLVGVLAGDKMANNRLTSVRAELVAAVEQLKPRNDNRSRFLLLTREFPRFLDEEEAVRVARNEGQVTARVVERAKIDEPSARLDWEAIVRSKAIAMQQDMHRSTLQTLAALNGLAAGLARVAGPKTIVFLSEGFVVHDIQGALRSVADRTARAGGRVYAIDVRGLGRGINPALLETASSQPDDLWTEKVGAQGFDNIADGTSSLAVDTGGLLIRNENNFDRAMERIADDASRAYVLTYHAANTNYDGKFRRIEVRVKRPGVKVRARRGYLAIDPSKLASPGRIPNP